MVWQNLPHLYVPPGVAFVFGIESHPSVRKHGASMKEFATKLKQYFGLPKVLFSAAAGVFSTAAQIQLLSTQERQKGGEASTHTADTRFISCLPCTI